MPTPTITVPIPVSDTFSVTINYDRGVTGFADSDLQLSVNNHLVSKTLVSATASGPTSIAMADDGDAYYVVRAAYALGTIPCCA